MFLHGNSAMQLRVIGRVVFAWRGAKL